MADDQIQEIKSKIDIVDLVSGYVGIKKAGKNYKGLCPFHKEKTPSFMVSPELQIFKCFGCSKGGDIFTFLQEIEGIEFPEALRMLAERGAPCECCSVQPTIVTSPIDASVASSSTLAAGSESGPPMLASISQVPICKLRSSLPRATTPPPSL